MFWVSEYIKYLFKRKNKYGIHSPFIFNLLINIEKTKFTENFILLRKLFNNFYLNNNNSISINDLGSGSRKNNGNVRLISEIFKNSSSKGKYSKLLYILAKNYSKNAILELGTNLGYGTLHLSQGNPKTDVYSVEGCKNILSFPIKLFSENKIKNVKFINSSFNDYLLKDEIIYDLIFIDGHHNSTALNNYMNLLIKNIHDDTLIVIDDIRWNKDMLSFWNECIKRNEYNVSIDLFRMGILIKKPGQVKEHFVLKY